MQRQGGEMNLNLCSRVRRLLVADGVARAFVGTPTDGWESQSEPADVPI
jgi:hypothetical protein